MAAEKRKWYRCELTGEDNTNFVIPMSDTEHAIFMDILSRINYLHVGEYAPSMYIERYGYSSFDEVKIPEYSYDWENGINPFDPSKTFVIEGVYDEQEDEQDDTQ